MVSKHKVYFGFETQKTFRSGYIRRSEIWPHTLHCTDETRKVETVALSADALLPKKHNVFCALKPKYT